MGGADPADFLKVYMPWAPKTMKNRGFGHLTKGLFTINNPKHVGFGAHGAGCQLRWFFRS